MKEDPNGLEEAGDIPRPRAGMDAAEERSRDYARYAADFQALREEIRRVNAVPGDNTAKSAPNPPATVPPATAPHPERPSPPNSQSRSSVARDYRPLHGAGTPSASGQAGPRLTPSRPHRQYKSGLIPGLVIAALLLFFPWSVFNTQTTGPASPQSSPPSPSQPTVPTHVTLTCDTTIGGSECSKPLNPMGDILALDLNGVTSATLDALCGEGYESTWSDNIGNLISVGNWNGDKTCFLGMYNTAEGSPIVDFYPPWAHGPWIVTWQLRSPSGLVVATAQYTTSLV